jgi:hypothetical protein
MTTSNDQAQSIQRGADESLARDKAKAVQDKNDLAEFKAILVTNALEPLGVHYDERSGIFERLAAQLGKKLSYREIETLSKLISYSEAMKSRRYDPATGKWEKS